jgi:hypothetical protein
MQNEVTKILKIIRSSIKVGITTAVKHTEFRKLSEVSCTTTLAGSINISRQMYG